MSTFAVVCILVLILLATVLALRASTYRVQRNFVLLLFLVQVMAFFVSGVAVRVVISQGSSALYRQGASDLAVALSPFLLISALISLAIYLNFLFKKRG